MLVPAVAATQVRLVLFIFIRFKAYLDGIYELFNQIFARVLYERKILGLLVER